MHPRAARRFAIALAAIVVAATAGPKAGTTTRPTLITMTVRVDDAAGVGDRLVDAALAEARAIWAPNGVLLTRAVTSDAPACLTVTMDARPQPVQPALRALPLGRIEFDRREMPQPQIRVAVAAIFELLGRDQALARLGRMPPARWWEAVAHAIGRVIAHEVGHFVLRLPAHTPHGLMSASHSSVDLAGPDRGPFALTTLLRPRLDAMLRLGAGVCARETIEASQ